MISLDWHQIAWAAGAILLTLLILRAFMRWTCDAGNTFEIRDLFMENGRASKGAVVLMGAYVATTWHFVYYTVTGRMTEGYFGLYSAAWIAPIVARVIFGEKPQEPKP